MNIINKLDTIHVSMRRNQWMQYFTTFTRLALVAGFLPAGYVKIIGERFTDLHNNQPMGHYLEALHHTGYYYTFIGYAQVLAALLLLFPRTVVLGVFIYLPIIFNIFILTLAVRFEGSLLTAPLMVIACVYLLCWHYDRVKYLLPFNTPPYAPLVADKKFPGWFFAGVFATFLAVGFTVTHLYTIMPRNTLADCELQCNASENPEACKVFCHSIHNNGQDLDRSLDVYQRAVLGNRKKAGVK